MMKTLKELLNFKDNKELAKRKNIEGTPLVVVTTDEGSFVTMGRYRLTDPMKSEKEAENYVERKPWALLLAVMDVYVTAGIELQEQKKKNLKNLQDGELIAQNETRKEDENGNN